MFGFLKSPANNVSKQNSATPLAELPFMDRNKMASDEPSSSKAKTTKGPDQTGKKVGRASKLGSSSERREDDDDFFEDLPEQCEDVRLKLVVFEWVSLFFIVGALLISLSIPYLRKRTIWRLLLWKWEVLGLVLVCGRLLSSWGIGIIIFFIQRNFIMRKRVLYFIYGLRRPVQNSLWLGLVMVTWQLFFYIKFEGETNSATLKLVTNALVCLFIASVIWLGKTLVVKVLASSFHVSNYFDRIRESLINQYVIHTLSGPPLVEMRKEEEEEEKIGIEVETPRKVGAVIGNRRVQTSPDKGGKRIKIDDLRQLSLKDVSAWNMKRLMDEQISESSKKIDCESEARAVAYKIFQNVAQRGSRNIYLEDLAKFMPAEEAEKTMRLFQGAPDKVSKSSLKKWVVAALRERRALALTLDDTNTVVNTVDKMVSVLAGIIVAVIGLVIFGIETKRFLIFISSSFLLAGFLFGNSCKMVIEGIVFLFAMHPFDIGDRCEIDGIEMVVEEINILTSVFLRYDNGTIIIPNCVLIGKAITNYRRSPDMQDEVEFRVPISTPAEKIAMIKQKIICYIENRKDHWYPTPIVIFKDLEDLNRIRIAIRLTHRINHQDMDEKRARKALLVEELVKILKEVDVNTVDT